MKTALNFISKCAPIGGLILLVLTFLALVLSIVAYCAARRFVISAARAKGTVTELGANTQGGDPSARLAFTFTDQNGAEHSVCSTVGQAPPPYTVGDAVSVLYDPSNPSDAKIDSLLSVWFWAIFAGILSACLLMNALSFIFLVPWAARFLLRQMAVDDNQPSALNGS